VVMRVSLVVAIAPLVKVTEAGANPWLHLPIHLNAFIH